MKQYLDLCRHVLNSTEKYDRYWRWRKKLIRYQMRFDLSEGFPLLTTKESLKAIIHELYGS